MKKAFFAIYVCLIICLSCTQIVDEKLKYYKSKYSYASAEDWDRITFKSAYIENNVWGKEYLRNNYQIIFSDSIGKEFGWNWEYAYTTKRISANPCLIIGKKPWSNTTSNTLFPTQIENIDSLSCSFAFTSDGTGNFENSLTVWITDKKQSKFNDIVFLLVFVFNNIGTDRVGKLVDTISLNNMIMDEYFCKNKEHGICIDNILFYVRNINKDLFFDLKAYLNYLVGKKYLSKDNYVASIELLTNIKWGVGETVIKNFNYILNTK